MDLPSQNIKNLMEELEGQTIAWDAMQQSTFPYFATIINQIDNLQYLFRISQRDFDKEEDNDEEGMGVLNFFDNSKEKLIVSNIEKIEKLITILRSSLGTFENITNRCEKIRLKINDYYLTNQNDIIPEDINTQKGSFLDISVCIEFSKDLAKMYKMELLVKKDLVDSIDYEKNLNDFEVIFERWKKEDNVDVQSVSKFTNLIK